MGECAYYMKAAFKSPAEAKRAATKLDNFFGEMKDAQDFYQEGDVEGKKSLFRKNFWKEFRKRFPAVMEYVETLYDYKPGCNTDVLCGNLDIGTDENNECLVDGNVVAWGDACVWHMANWAPLAAFIKSKFGATRVVWDHEENGCGSLDSLQLYDYQGIVEDILKNEALLPLLIGVHPDLTELVEQSIRVKSRRVPRSVKT